MYIFVLVPNEDPVRPPQNSFAEIVRGHLAPFGGVVTEICEHIVDPEKVNFTPIETVIAPEPWFKGNVVLVGDTVHTATPHLGAGAAMCLEDALVLGDELSRGATNVDALTRYSKRRFERCKYVVETSAQLSYAQTHPTAPDADPGVLWEAIEVLAAAF